MRAREQVVPSAAAELTVVSDCVPPTIVAVTGLVPQNQIIVRYDAPMNPLTATDSFNYLIGSNREYTPFNVFMSDPFTAVLELDPILFSLSIGQRYRLQVDLVSAAGSDSQCVCSFIRSTEVEFLTVLSPQIRVLENPTNKVILALGTGTFSARAEAMSNGMILPVNYQWQQYAEDRFNWVDIPGATNATYTTPRYPTCTSTPLVFRCRFQADATVAFSAQALLQVIADCSPPVVVSTLGDVRRNIIIVQFSDTMEPASASDLFNYTLSTMGIDPAPIIESIHMTNGYTAVLVLAAGIPMREDTIYTLGISGLMDFGDPACGCNILVPTSVRFQPVRECFRITQQPQSQTVIEGCSAEFRVAARWLDQSAPRLTSQWLKNGEAISGATNRTYTTGPVALTDHGTTFSAVIRSDCRSVTSAVAVLSVALDQVPPVLAFARSGQAANTVILNFVTACGRPDGRLNEFLATDSFNYTASGNLSVLRAALDCTGLQVCLLTSPQQPMTQYTIYVNNLEDEKGNSMTGIAQATFTAQPRIPGVARVLRYSVDANQLLLEWEGSGVLESALSPTGPWNEPELQQQSPYLVIPSPFGCSRGEPVAPQYYRVRWESP